MICLICEKEIAKLHDGTECINGGGCLIASFGYGSKHDQIHGYIENSTPLDKLLNCDEVVAYICDDCTERKTHCFEGYRVVKKETRDRQV